jgi:hypothetical protein
MPYVVPERHHRPPRRQRPALTDLLPAAERERRIADMIREALELLEVERLGTVHRNPDDDDEAPNRRLGTRKKRQ